MLATAMMYVRVYLLALFFNVSIAEGLTSPFLVYIGVSVAYAVYFLRITQGEEASPHPSWQPKPIQIP